MTNCLLIPGTFTLFVLHKVLITPKTFRKEIFRKCARFPKFPKINPTENFLLQLRYFRPTAWVANKFAFFCMYYVLIVVSYSKLIKPRNHTTNYSKNFI